MAELSDREIADSALKRIFESDPQSAAIMEPVKAKPEWRLFVSNTTRMVRRLRPAETREAESEHARNVLRGTVEMMLASPEEKQAKLHYLTRGSTANVPPAAGKEYSEFAGTLARHLVREIITCLDEGISGPGGVSTVMH